jgi:hypothetical protein
MRRFGRYPVSDSRSLGRRVQNDGDRSAFDLDRVPNTRAGLGERDGWT